MVAANLVAQAAGLAAGVVAVKFYLDYENALEQSSSNSCPTCHGSKKVPCFCRNWSDNDSGCGTCSGSGRMRCSTCGGSGTARPIPVRIQSSQR